MMTRRRLFGLVAGLPAAITAALARPSVPRDSVVLFSAPPPVAPRAAGRWYSVSWLGLHLRSITTWQTSPVPAWAEGRVLYRWCPDTWQFDPVYDRVWIPESDARLIMWAFTDLWKGHTYTLQMTRLPTWFELEGWTGHAGYFNGPFDFPDCDWVAYGNGGTLRSRSATSRVYN